MKHASTELVMILVFAGFVAVCTMTLFAPGSPQEMISIPGKGMKRRSCILHMNTID